MWWVVIILLLAIGAKYGWFIGALAFVGWLLCLHVRNLYKQRYM